MREKFWIDRFTEKSHARDVENQPNDMKIKLSKDYANKCLDEYDKTFKKDRT